jgi:ABC-2 type transport system ATP-binding protein
VSEAADAIIRVEHLSKQYRAGVRRKRVHAVTDASFDVQKGEVFGFVGPNGAGKTTTIRVLMGLVKPSAGSVSLFGKPIPSRATRARLGFLPEAPYFYDYLSAREYLDLVGRLFGMDAAARKKRAAELCDKVGLGAAADRPMKKYSKGMLQRAGLAQALMNDPELVVLDEPMSGLDPIGRKEVRDLIHELRDAGKTIFFSTHILPDVEAICDRVAIIVSGKVLDVGPVDKLLDATLLGTDVVLAQEPVDLPAGAKARRVGDSVNVALPPEADVAAFLRANGRIVSVTPRKESLEDLFVKRAKGMVRE